MKLTCHCGFTDDLEQFDDVGACPGNLFCPRCGQEIDSDTGDPAVRCGKCDACEEVELDAGEGQLDLF